MALTIKVFRGPGLPNFTAVSTKHDLYSVECRFCHWEYEAKWIKVKEAYEAHRCWESRCHT